MLSLEKLLQSFLSCCCCQSFLAAEVFVVVDPEQELCQVWGGGVHLHPRHNLKEERGVPAKLLGDVLYLSLLPGAQHQCLGQQQQRAETIAQLHDLLQTVQDLSRGE